MADEVHEPRMLDLDPRSSAVLADFQVYGGWVAGEDSSARVAHLHLLLIPVTDRTQVHMDLLVPFEILVQLHCSLTGALEFLSQAGESIADYLIAEAGGAQ